MENTVYLAANETGGLEIRETRTGLVVEWWTRRVGETCGRVLLSGDYVRDVLGIALPSEVAHADPLAPPTLSHDEADVLLAAAEHGSGGGRRILDKIRTVAM